MENTSGEVKVVSGAALAAVAGHPNLSADASGFLERHKAIISLPEACRQYQAAQRLAVPIRIAQELGL